MEKVRGTESKEKSFLKGVVGKRLEELASSQTRVDPLELLGLSPSPTSSVPSEPKAATSSPSGLSAQDVSIATSISSKSDPVSPSAQKAASLEPISSSRPAVKKRVALPEYSDSPRRHSDSGNIRSLHSESHTVRDSVSSTDSLPHTSPTHPDLHLTPVAPPLQMLPPADIPISLLKPPSHWVRFAWALHSCRDQSIPTQTRPVSYAEIGALVDRTEDAVRRSLLQLMNAGLIVRTALLQHANGGSIYLFGQAFPALLTPVPTSKKKGPRPRHHQTLHSQSNSHLHSQNTISSSSSSSLSNSELLQEWGVHHLILSEYFSAVDPKSVEPFLRVMPSVEYAQDFFDKVAGVIDHKKTSPKPIGDALGFLFACLKKMEVNPPPGWKSRRVRLLEDEARRLEDETAALKAARDRIESQRSEVYFLNLPEETQTQLRNQAQEAAPETDLAVVRDAKRDRRLQELIREHMHTEHRRKPM